MPLPKNILPKLDDIAAPEPEEYSEDSYEDDEFLEDLSDEDFGNLDDNIVDFGDMIEDDEYSQMVKEQESEDEEVYHEEPDVTPSPKPEPAEKPVNQSKKIKGNKPLKAPLGSSPSGTIILGTIRKYKIPIIILSSVLAVVLILFIVLSFIGKGKSGSKNTEPSSVESAVEIGSSDENKNPKGKNYYIKDGKLVVKPKSDKKEFKYIEAAVLTKDGITRCVSFDIKLKETHEQTVLNDCDIDLTDRTIEDIIIFEKD